MAQGARQAHQPKLELQFPCIKKIKMRMKNNPDISIDQVKGFDRRVRNSPFLFMIVHFAHQQEHRSKVYFEKYKKAQSELDRIDQSPYMNLQRENEELKQRCADLQAQIDKLTSAHPSPCASCFS